jgi:DHA1 family multidrug resistance protein-like MFS transporter
MAEINAKLDSSMQQWHWTLYVAFASQMLALLGFKFVWPFLPLYLATLGVPNDRVPLWAGIIAFSEDLPMALAAPFWGVLGDQYGRKIMVVRAMLSGAIITGLLIAAPNVWAVLILMILSGILTGVISPLHAMVAAHTPSEHMGFSMGLMQSGIFMASGIGPFLGGLFNDHFDFQGSFVFGMSLLFAAALLVIFCMHEDFEHKQTPSGARFNIFSDLRVVMGLPGLLIVGIIVSCIFFGNMLVYPVIPLFVPQLNGIPQANGELQVSTMVGMIFGVTGMCSTIAAWQAHRLIRRFGYRRALIGAMVLAGVLYASVFFSQSIWYLLITRAIAGLCIGAALPIASAMIALIVPADRRSSAYGVMTALQSLGAAAGPLLGGLIGTVFGLRVVFPLTACVLGLVALVVMLNVREPTTP